MESNTIGLPVLFCLLVDFPNNNTDCAVLPNKSEPSICFECPIPGKFLTGDILDDHGSPGHVICTILWLFTIIIGIMGACGNCLIITVMKKHHKPRAFDFMLTILASFDLLTSVMAPISSTAMVIFYEGINHGPATLIFYYVPFLICLIGRSGSVYMTVVITIERYLVLAFPIKSSEWFTYVKTKLITLAVVILAVIVNVPRFTSLMIEYNYMGQNVPSLRHLEYIIKATSLENFWYTTMKAAHYAFDMWLPFPVLIIFNVMLFLEIRKFTKKRRELNKKLVVNRDIRAARMFIPVCGVIFICNLEPITHYLILHFKNVYYRELVLGMTLSIVLNAAANLPIYYARGTSFRGEIRAALAKLCGKSGEQFERTREVSTVY